MNVGQILETHLGAVSVDLGKKFYDTAINIKNKKTSIDDLKSLFKKIYGSPQKKQDALKEIINEAFTGEGTMVNSGFLNGLNIESAKVEILEYLEKKNLGSRKINYKLRDWGVSRQRYWGCPIPILYREDGKVLPVQKKDLPVMLPKNESKNGYFNSLKDLEDWKTTICPETGMKAVRETDTFDTFFESSWYFLRFCNPRLDDPLDFEDIKYWLPVDQYIGGIEHAILHLLYSRFFTKALFLRKLQLLEQI